MLFFVETNDKMNFFANMNSFLVNYVVNILSLIIGSTIVLHSLMNVFQRLKVNKFACYLTVVAFRASVSYGLHYYKKGQRYRFIQT